MPVVPSPWQPRQSRTAGLIAGCSLCQCCVEKNFSESSGYLPFYFLAFDLPLPFALVFLAERFAEFAFASSLAGAFLTAL